MGHAVTHFLFLRAIFEYFWIKKEVYIFDFCKIKYKISDPQFIMRKFVTKFIYKHEVIEY